MKKPEDVREGEQVEYRVDGFANDENMWYD